MTHSFRIILHVIFMLGIISIGYKTEHPDGTVHKGEINQVDGSGKKQGPWKIYADSILIAQGTYTNGELNGLWTYWYQNAQKKEEGHYNLGVKNGSITREAESDLFILNTSSDMILTMAIGYMPELGFKDFRNLVRKIDFKIR